MNKKLFPLVVIVAAVIASSSCAQGLKVGDAAPDFTTKGALAGQEFDFNLKNQLKKGAVVLYFFPKVFTPGCTLEAHDFAEATEDFKKAGANIIGMSGDDIEGLKKFSIEECRNKFPVAIATPQIIQSYNVALAVMPNRTNRTTYVIGKNGKIKMIYSDGNYMQHKIKALEAVKAKN